jgi:hypothetical protein
VLSKENSLRRMKERDWRNKVIPFLRQKYRGEDIK